MSYVQAEANQARADAALRLVKQLGIEGANVLTSLGFAPAEEFRHRYRVLRPLYGGNDLALLHLPEPERPEAEPEPEPGDVAIRALQAADALLASVPLGGKAEDAHVVIRDALEELGLTGPPAPPVHQLPDEPGAVVLLSPGGVAMLASGRDRSPLWLVPDIDGGAWRWCANNELPAWLPAEVVPEGTAAALAEARRALGLTATEKAHTDWAPRSAQDALDRMHALDQGGA